MTDYPLPLPLSSSSTITPNYHQYYYYYYYHYTCFFKYNFILVHEECRGLLFSRYGKTLMVPSWSKNSAAASALDMRV